MKFYEHIERVIGKEEKDKLENAIDQEQINV
jgi:hypothetical protein